MEVGGCDLVDLARQHGTPVYIYDEATVRQRSREYVAAMGRAGQVLYSAKAFASPRFLRVVAEEGLGLDVVSAGELHLALRSSFPPERIHFLGNNKSLEDLAAAHGAGATTVIDGDHEFDLLSSVVPDGERAPVMLRLSPGVKPDTHDHISTGQLDSKFGFSIESGAARKAIEVALKDPRLELVGLHSHIGSQIFALGAYADAMEIMLDLLVTLRDELKYEPRKLGAGGGLGIAYTRNDDPPTPRHFVEVVHRALELSQFRHVPAVFDDAETPGPAERIVGLSKLARVVDRFARDLQLQERLTMQIADWVQEQLEPKGVGVVLEAEHLCMSLRGVQKAGARTVTSALHGLVRDDPRTRQEFLALTTRSD